MTLVTVGGADVLEARLVADLRGTIHVRCLLDTAKQPSGRVSLVAEGGLTISMTVMEPGGVDQQDRAHVNLVAGAGGLAKELAQNFRNAFFRDPLDALCRAGGETRSDTVAADVLSEQLAHWTIQQGGIWRGLNALTAYLSRTRGTLCNWRTLADGSVWLGAETWPTQTFAEADVIRRFEGEDGRVSLGVQTLQILPGVELDGVGRVRSVDYHVLPESVSCEVHLL